MEAVPHHRSSFRPVLLPIVLLAFASACKSQVVYPTPAPEVPVFLPAGQTAQATPGVPSPDETQEPTEIPPTEGPAVVDYTVKSGDTLGGIALHFDIPTEEIMRLNNLASGSLLSIGTTLRIPVRVTQVSPADRLIPDSELVYSPGYAGFDTLAFAAKEGGYLNSYVERVDGEQLTGPQIIQLVAERYSVGPRVLLALLQWQSGWVTGQPANAAQKNFPMGLADGAKSNLYKQARWAASALNEGYYGKLKGSSNTLLFQDKSRVRVNPALNPGTAGLQMALAATMKWNEFQGAVGTGDKGFIQAYRALFGEPTTYAIEPLLPKGLKQPPMRLPWMDGAKWFFVGGPHAGWDVGSGWAAIDFSPNEQAGTCWPSVEWAVATAPGLIVRSEHGRVIEMLDGNDFTSAGWSVMYMHMGKVDRVAVGARIQTGDHIGHPSCEGGFAESSHLHIARRYNGQWMTAEGPVPFDLSGWVFKSSGQEYDGTMIRGPQTKDSCNCRSAKNAVIADGGALTGLSH